MSRLPWLTEDRTGADYSQGQQ